MKKKRFWPMFCLLTILLLVVLAIYRMPWGFARQVGKQEKQLRLEVVHTAESFLGANEKDGSHREIIDLYNAHAPLARGYQVQYDDAWCATFESAVAIQCGLTDLIPTECSCQKQIDLFREKKAWIENDDYVPLPGDLIFYHRNCLEPGECEKPSDHVGIVVGTAGTFIKVIEGNYKDKVTYRITKVDASHIRGYGVPDYESKT